MSKGRGATSPAGTRRDRCFETEARPHATSLLPAPGMPKFGHLGRLDPIEGIHASNFRKFQNVSPERCRSRSPETGRGSSLRSRDLCRLFLRKTKELDPNYSTLPITRKESDSRISATQTKFLEKDGGSLKEPGDRLICMFRGNESYLRRAVKRRHNYWMENRLQSEHGMQIFDVLFTLQDQITDYASLQPT